MDKNTIIGFVLIFALVIGFTQLNKPSDAEIAAQHARDSIALVEKKKAEQQQLVSQNTLTDTLSKDTSKLSDAFGSFSVAAKGEEKLVTLENDLVKLTFSSKGGRIYSAELKKYSRKDSLDKKNPLILFEGKESNMNFILTTNNNRVLNSSELYFDASNIIKGANGDQTLVMRLRTATQGYIDFIYNLPASSYMMNFDIKANGMTAVMPGGINSLEMQWKSRIPQQEKGRTFEERYTNIQYKFTGGDLDKLSESKDDEKKPETKVQWIAFKDQFFSSILIANEGMTSARLKSTMEEETSKYLKSYSADVNVAFDPTGKVPTSFRMFFGPNQHKVLSAFDDNAKTPDQELQLTKLIPLGWWIFGGINEYVIIPMFDFLSKFFSNFGVIILIMTLIIKLVLFPLTYKSYMSSAKMRVLKPEIDEINARIPAEKAAERQKATMELYGKVGVSPLSGCIPALLSMPLLFAMFSFFPSAIELRQQSFLWATDLSAYDSIMTLPFSIPFGFGNHVSLFTLLMTVTNIVYTKLNMANTTPSDQPGAGLMKWMMYLMPVMFLFMFNGYASGLTFYYFISTLISISQTYLFRAFVDDKKILAELHAKRNSKKNNPNKKPSFMERLEKMQREQMKASQNRK